MAITNITRNATIDEWRIQTNLSANSINRIETGYFNKSNGTFEITNTGVLSITATGTPLQVSNAAQFSTNVSIGRNLTIGVVGANTGNVEVGSRVSIQGSGIALTVANNVVIGGSANGLVVANNILSNNYTSNNIVNVGTILNVGGDANLKSNLIVKGNFTLNTNKFIVETSNGDTTIAGNTNVVSYLIVQKDADLKGNLAVKDNFTVNTDKFIIQTSNGDTTIAGNTSVAKDFNINTDKFTVVASTGNTSISGKLDVTGTLSVNNKVTVDKDTGATAIAGNLTIATDKFTVNSTTGDVVVAGNTSITKDLKINTDKFVVTGTTGATAIAGDVSVNTNKFTITSATGATAIAGDVAVATNKFTINSTTGDVVVSGNTNITKDLKINTDKFVVTGTTGATAIAGDVAVATNKFTINSTTGDTTISGNTNITKDLKINTDKFVVTGTTGATAIAGDVAVATNKFTISSGTGAIAIAGDVAVATNKFTINSTTGDVSVAGNTSITKDLKINTDKFVVTGTTGATAIAGDVAVATNKFTISSATGDTLISGTLNVNNKANIVSSSGDITTQGKLFVTGEANVNNKVIITASTGDTSIAGKLFVTGEANVNNKVVIASDTGNITTQGKLFVTGEANVNNKVVITAATGAIAIAGDVSVNTNKFTITSATGDTSIAGNTNIAKDLKINTDKFSVTGTTGATSIAGDVAITSATASSSTTTGALKVKGGISSEASVYAAAIYDNGARVARSASGTAPLTLSLDSSTGVLTGSITLSSATNSTAINEAATPSAVKAAYDLAGLKVAKAGDTMTGALEITNTTGSTSTTTGALKVKGGISSEANVFSPNVTATSVLTAKDARLETAILTGGLTGTTASFSGSMSVGGSFTITGESLIDTDRIKLRGSTKQPLNVGYSYFVVNRTTIPATANPTTDRIGLTSHGFTNGDSITLANVSSTITGISNNTIYYVQNKTDNDFQLALTQGGGAIDFNGTSGQVRVIDNGKRDAELRWNEPSKIWEIRDVGATDGYSKILTANLISDSTSSASSDTLASSKAVKTVADSIKNPQITINGGGNGLEGTGNFTLNQDGTATITLSHKNTSDVANVTAASDGIVLQGIKFDEFGHVAEVTTYNLDGRYYTESESDNRFINNSGDESMSGALAITKDTDSESTSTGALKISGGVGIAKNLYVGGNVVISKNLTVSGTTTYINTATLSVGDNIIELNADILSDADPTENAGIEVKRGNSPASYIRWNEDGDHWVANTGLINGEYRLANTTTYLAEGSNLYFTAARVRANVSVATGSLITYDNTTGVFDIGTITAAKGGTGLTSYLAGDILYADSTTTLAKLAKGTDGQVLKLAAGIPAWAAEYSYSLPIATNGARGGVQIGYNTDAGNRNYAVQLSGEKMYVNVPWVDTNTTYSKATETELGLAKVNNTTQSTASNSLTTTANRTYAVQFDANERLVVNVPWADTNTTYSVSLNEDGSGNVPGVSASDFDVVLTDSSSVTDKVTFRGGKNIVLSRSIDVGTIATTDIIQSSYKIAMPLDFVNKGNGTITLSGTAINSAETVGNSGNPRQVIFHPNGRLVYVINESTDRISYGIVDDYGVLSSMSGSYATPDAPWRAAIHPNGNYIYIVNRGTDATRGTLYRYTIDQTSGALSNGVALTTALGNSSIWGIAIDPRGKYLYFTSYDTNLIYQFSIDETTGDVTASTPATISISTNPHSLAIDPSGRFLFVSCSGSTGKIASYGINQTAGTLTELSSITTVSGQSTILIDASGRFLYSIGSNRLYQFSINQNTGALITIANYLTLNDGGATGEMAIDPLGTYLYVSNFNTNIIRSFSINSWTGVLTERQSFAGVTNLLGLTVDPFRRYLYGGSSSGTNSIYRFSISSSSLGQTTVSGRIASSSVTTGSLVVDGGIGANGNIYSTGVFDTGIRVVSVVSPSTPITASISSGTLTISHATAGTAGTYANATHVPVISTNATGHVTGITNTAISFPVTSVAGRTGAVTISTSDVSGYVDTTNAANITSGTLPAARIPNTTVPAGTYGTSTQVGSFTVGSDGRLTGASATNITFPVTSVAGRTGAVTLSTSDVSGLATSATTDTTNATNITSGTLAAARLGTTGAPQFASLGIGTAASGTTGEIRATGDITAGYSDDKLKNRIGNIENALDKVSQLAGFYYTPNDLAKTLGYNDRIQVGLSAQEVQNVLPEVVVPAPIDSKFLTVQYERMIPLLVEAIKELSKEIQEIKKKL